MITKPRHIAHVINTLAVGGAETMLVKLLTHSDRRMFTHRVYTLMSPAGPLAAAAADLGVPVRAIGMRRGIPNPLRVLRLSRWLRQDPPDLVQTWLYHSDLVGGLATRFARIPVPVVWNIRNGTLDRSTSRRRTHWVVGACARASRWLPDAIVCCSHEALRVHTALGYDRTRCEVIPNGFDLGAFRPDASARLVIRRELGVPHGAGVVGLVARFDPQKDHQSFVEAAGRLHAIVPDAHFVLCGRNITRTNTDLARWIDAAGIRSACHLLGERTDIPAVTAAFDVATSSSAYGEAFPNVIGEAMACGVPCVVTDVGESAGIVGDTGRVVPPRDPDALARGWRDLLALSADDRLALGGRARRRVSDHFDIESVTRKYEDTYRRVIARGHGATDDARHDDARKEPGRVA